MDGKDSTVVKDSSLAKNSTPAKDTVVSENPAVARNATIPKDSSISRDSIISVVAIKNTPEPPTPLTDIETLGGNLPKVITAGKQPYFVTSDIYVPSGKTVTLEPGVVLLFKNFTGMHVEGRLVAEGTKGKTDRLLFGVRPAYNPGSTLKPIPMTGTAFTYTKAESVRIGLL